MIDAGSSAKVRKFGKTCGNIENCRLWLDLIRRLALMASRTPMNRRQFIKIGTVALAFVSLADPLHAECQKLKIGVTDWNLSQEAKPGPIELAKSIGFNGVEISLGRAPDRLPLSDSSLQEQFLSEARKHQFPIASTCLDILHQNYLKYDPHS